MFTDHRPYRFHIELTDKCNAGCPMCARTDPLNFCKADKSRVKKIELSLDDIQRSFTPEFCKNVEEVDLCGTYGDPIAASQCLEICQYFAQQDINIILSTNGGLRSTGWWERLGRAISKTRSKVELHVDGLGDINALYRVHTKFDRIMENITAYLATGAVAEWNFILFKHNEHQVMEARALAAEMGFNRFILIDTVRFGSTGNFKYQLPDGSIRKLEPSAMTAADFTDNGPSFKTSNEDKTVDETRIDSAQRGISNDDINGINCKAEIRNRAYIDATGAFSACCWISGSKEEQVLKNNSGNDADSFNIRNQPMASLMHSEPFHSLYTRDWRAGGNKICRRKCGDMKRNKRTEL